jgi:nucleotide-binding universal stress UspA family protein
MYRIIAVGRTARKTISPGPLPCTGSYVVWLVLYPEPTEKIDAVTEPWGVRKDSREARRAVLDALPFLREASRVTVVEICESGEESTAQEHIEDVARYLSRHRISCGPRVIIHQEGPGAAQLIRLARDEGADLIVVGAYGHSRLGEWMFGGMTRDLLATSPICCLMSH